MTLKLGGLLLVGTALVSFDAHAAGGNYGTSLRPAEPVLTSPADQPAPIGVDPPYFETDWSLGLRGSYINSGSDQRYEVLALPSASLTHTGDTLSYHATVDGQVSSTDGGSTNVDQARLSAGSALQFNADTSLATDASFAMTQEDVHAPDVASDVAETPVNYDGSADATLTRKFGRFNVSLGGTAGRSVYGPTTLKDASLIDNSGQNNTDFGGSLRLGFALSPVFEVFGKVDATRTLFDAADPNLGVKLDGNLYTARAGFVATWGDELTASASIGQALEQFDAAGLPNVTATLYDASINYKATSTLTLAGDFATTVGAPGPNGSGSAQIAYAATASAAYTVNDWLDWRGSAGWNSATYAGTSNTSKGYSFGVGADYLLSQHAKLSADYDFAHASVTPNPATDTHTVSVGFTLQK